MKAKDKVYPLAVKYAERQGSKSVTCCDEEYDGVCVLKINLSLIIINLYN